jgi:hypothetical protein
LFSIRQKVAREKPTKESDNAYKLVN